MSTGYLLSDGTDLINVFESGTTVQNSGFKLLNGADLSSIFKPLDDYTAVNTKHTRTNGSDLNLLYNGIPQPIILTTATTTTTTYRSSGTVSYPTDKLCEIIVIGGGGGGGSSGNQNRAGGGGSGGGIVYFKYNLIANVIYTFIVGTGGKARGQQASAAGINGDDSSFSNLATAIGGNGGSAYSGAYQTTSVPIGQYGTGGAEVSGNVSADVSVYTIYYGGVGGGSWQQTLTTKVAAANGGSVSMTNELLLDNTTYINHYSGGGAGCDRGDPTNAGSFGNGGVCIVDGPVSVANYLLANVSYSSCGSGGGANGFADPVYTAFIGRGARGAVIICAPN